MTYAPTYRYAVGIFGGSYSQPDQMEPAHWFMAQTLDDVRELILSVKFDHIGTDWETGDGGWKLSTPLYGDPGDGAYIYRVNRDHPDFSEVLDEPGDRARHAFGFID